MKPLRALGFRMFNTPSIEDIQWAKSCATTIREKNWGAMQRRSNPFFAPRRVTRGWRLGVLDQLRLRMDRISETPPKMKPAGRRGRAKPA